MDPMNPLGEPGTPPVEPAQEQVVTGYCRTCGKPLTQATMRQALGTVYCEEHAPHVNVPPPVEPPSPYSTPRPAPSLDAAPALAFFLGFIPGVGAIYNGQYAKGMIHVVTFGLLVSILSSDSANGLQPLFGMMLAAFVFYQAFEAYHTARKRQLGEPVDEFSGLASLSGRGRNFFAGPVLLIAVGVLFLLNNMGLLHVYQILRFWPVLLILLGISMLMNRIRAMRPEGSRMNGHVPEGMSHEQR